MSAAKCLTILLGVLLATGLASAQYNLKWSDWYNIDTPDGVGDLETLDEIKRNFPQMCHDPLQIEARTTAGLLARDTVDLVHYDVTEGLQCLNAQQYNGRVCQDYKVRFLCPIRTAKVRVEITNSEDDQVKWLPWTTWSDCDVTCGNNGMSRRIRKCRFENDRHCTREMTETKRCGETRCVPDTEPNQCVTSGVVTDANNIPLHGVQIALGRKIKQGFVLATTDADGWFEIRGVCASSDFTRMVARKRGFITSQIHPQINQTNGHATVALKLQDAEPFYILQHPRDKARLLGQTARFCCRSTGLNTSLVYSWFHNGSQIHQDKSSSDLFVTDLTFEDAGEYSCKVHSTVMYGNDVIRSNKATLTVTDASQRCDPTPKSKYIELPTECQTNQNSTGSNLFDVGVCPPINCPGSIANPGGCGETEKHYCCGAVEREYVEIKCKGNNVPVSKVTKCGCRVCSKPTIEVKGRAFGRNHSEPLRFGFVYNKNRTVAITSYSGEFSLIVEDDTKRLVLTFEDRFQMLMTTTKVLTFKSRGGVIYHDVKMAVRSAPVDVNPSQPASLVLKPVGMVEDNVGFVVTEADSFFLDGKPYRDNVKARITLVDPKSVTSYEEAPTDLMYQDDEGEEMPLQTFGMFEAEFRDDQMNLLQAAKVQIYVDSDQISAEKIPNTKLWSLNPVTGIWEEEEDFKVTSAYPPVNDDSPKRRKRESQTFLVGNLEVRERRMFNLDVAVENRCWMKVRTYRSEKFRPIDQISGVEITVINLEPLPGFQGNSAVWGRFDAAVTDNDGACVRCFCDENAKAYTAHVTAKIDDSEELTAASSRLQDVNKVGVSKDILDVLDYRRSDHSDPMLKKTSFTTNLPRPSAKSSGPIYRVNEYKQCVAAEVNDQHFRFYRTENYLYEFNTIYYDESDCMTWTPNYLNWWPSPTEFRACYIKVRVDSETGAVVRAKSSGGTHPQTKGQLYGIRDDRAVTPSSGKYFAACMEFKCSGMLYDATIPDRTLVSVTSQGDCYLYDVNSKLTEYLQNHPPTAEKIRNDEFRMLAPEDSLGHSYGIYTVTDGDPQYAKKIAIGRCFAGSSDVTSKTIKPLKGVGLHFRCGEVAVNEELP